MRYNIHSMSVALLARKRLAAILLAGAVLALGGCAGGGDRSVRAGAISAAKAPTRDIVLVHGAWLSAASWDRVAAELRQQGFSVTAVELPGHGADATPPTQLTLDGYVKAVAASLPAEGIAEVFCQDCSDADKRWLLDTHGAEAVPPLATPVTLTPGNFGKVPRVYVHTSQDMAVSFKLQKAMLAAAGGAQTVVTLDTSHAPMLTQPPALARIIAQAGGQQ